MTDAPKIDTQAPERTFGIMVGGEEWIPAREADARAAAAWIAGRDALANHISAMMTRCAEANDKTYPSYAEDMRDWATDVTNEAGDLHPPADASAALDRLIAERVREAVEAEREACAKVAGDLSTQWWSECKRVFDHHLEGKSDGADDIANAIRARSESDSHNNSKVVE